MLYGKTGRERIDLNGAWKVAWTEAPPDAATMAEGIAAGLVFHDCKVPGCIETDLHALGVLPDPFFGMNPLAVNEFTQKLHVFYAKAFTYSSKDGFDPFLVLEGVDCFADIYLNGEEADWLGNALIEHDLDISEYLRDGTNELFIHIRPAREEATHFEYPQMLYALKINMESVYVRKAAHMYGWDIMPRFISAGLYRPVYVEYRPAVRFEDVYLKTTKLAGDHSSAQLLLHYKFTGDLYEKYRVRIDMTCGDSAVAAEVVPVFIAGNFWIDVKNPKLWHPKGRGAANLYDVRVSLFAGGVCVDTLCFRHGIRMIELLRTSVVDAQGQGEFVFKVNGEKIFAKGTNWVPADAFHWRDKERLPKMLEMANDLNCNMIRCWGGNVYEDELFYDICDESGILIWQDFGMACAVYPQDAEFQNMLAYEAEAVVKRLRSHACVALWSGDNECDWAYEWAGSRTDPNTNVLTRKVLTEAVRLHDGTRPYIGSSPYFDEEGYKTGERFLSEIHLWGPRDYFKSGYYIHSPSRFVSEIGYHGCPSPESMKKFLSPDKLWPWQGNDEWLLHASSPFPDVYPTRVPLMANQIGELFTESPDNLEDFSFASQAVQAEAKKFFIEMFRMAKWNRTGILWWNLIDGWPQFSDAIVDYYYDKKLAYGFVKASQQDVCVMLAESDAWHQQIYIVNDTPDAKTLSYEIQDVETGIVEAAGTHTVKADSSTAVGKIPFVRSKQRMFAMTWTGDASGKNHYLAGQPPFTLAEYKQLLKKSGVYGL
jgi:beta-mannosidase